MIYILKVYIIENAAILCKADSRGMGFSWNVECKAVS